MPRYKCKVDIVYPFTLEVNATTQEELHIKLLDYQYNLENAEDRILEIADIEELSEVAALFTYPALPEDAPQDLKDAYAVFEKYLKASVEPLHKQESTDTGLFIGVIPTDLKEKIRKQSDTTKITQQQYDVILEAYSLYIKGYITNVNTTDKFTEYLNKLIGLNKSRSVYSKIWNGSVNRESLPKGE